MRQQRNETKYLICILRRQGDQGSCVETAKISSGKLTHIKAHSHEPDPKYVQVSKTKLCMKRNAEESTDLLGKIFDHCCSQNSSAAPNII